MGVHNFFVYNAFSQDACIVVQHMHLARFTFSHKKYLTIFYTSLSMYNEKRSTLRYRKTTGSAQVSFAETQFLTLANLFFSLSTFLPLSLFLALSYLSSREFAVGFAFPSHR